MWRRVHAQTRGHVQGHGAELGYYGRIRPGKTKSILLLYFFISVAVENILISRRFLLTWQYEKILNNLWMKKRKPVLSIVFLTFSK